jgi:hypothetical protein
MTMKAGATDTIEYMAPGENGRRSAYLTDVDVKNPGPIQETDDPDWVVYNPHDGSTNKVEWMWYLNPGGVYQCQLHSQFAPGPDRIATEFEHERDDGENNHNDKRMDFKDWDGNWWRATVNTAYGPFPKRPTFNLEPLAL